MKKILERLINELEEIEVLRTKIKERNFIYQIDLKEEKARSLNLPLNAFYELPYEKWAKIRDSK